MYAPAGVKTSTRNFRSRTRMKAWVLGDPGELKHCRQAGAGAEEGRGAGAHRRGRDLRDRSRDHLSRAAGARSRAACRSTRTSRPGHEYMGTVVALGPGVDEYKIGQRVTVEIHAGCGQCKRCREGMYTSCHNYGLNYGDVDKGHRANGFTTDGGFCEYQVNNINTLVAIPDDMSDEEATLVVTAGTAMYGADRARRAGRRRERGGHRSGPDRAARRGGRQGAGRAARHPHRHARQPPARSGRSSAPTTSSTSARTTDVGGRRCDGSTAARASTTWSSARARPTPSTRRSAWSTAAARSASPPSRTSEAPVDVAHIVRNNIYVYGIRGEGKSATHRAEAFMAQKRFDATKIHTHTFPLEDLPTAIRYAKDRVEDAIKVVVKAKTGAASRSGGVAAQRVTLTLGEGAAQRPEVRSASPVGRGDSPTEGSQHAAHASLRRIPDARPRSARPSPRWRPIAAVIASSRARPTRCPGRARAAPATCIFRC